MTKKLGRPKLPRGEKQDAIIHVRLRHDERKRLEAAAKHDGVKASTWIKRAIARPLAAPVPPMKIGKSTWTLSDGPNSTIKLEFSGPVSLEMWLTFLKYVDGLEP